MDVRPANAAQHPVCSYGLSRVNFRGPRRPVDEPYVACIGGSETFARFVHLPYPALIEGETGAACLNLGAQKAGPDLFLGDGAIHALIHDASAVVIQVLGATNLSNRFYRVHPRRNDRFVAPNPPLQELFPEIDFTEFAFTGHLVARLQATDPARFDVVKKALRATWVRRMKRLIASATGPVTLLWFAHRGPDDPAVIGQEPALVTRKMLNKVMGDSTGLVEVVCPQRPFDGPADVAEAMDADDHDRAAQALVRRLS